MESIASAAKWQKLAEQASVEMDGKKLMALVRQLCATFDGEKAKLPPLRPLL